MYVRAISTRLVTGKSTPAIRAIVLSLSLLVFLVRTDHADHALAPHDLAFVANPLHRRSHFHQILKSSTRRFSNLAHDPSTAFVRRRQLHFHPVTHQHAHEVALDPIRDVRLHDVTALLQLHTIHRVREQLGHHARYFRALTGTS